jgi:cobalamin biosynthesis Mg chelatase CobN
LTAITPPVPYIDANGYNQVSKIAKNETPTLSNALIGGATAKSPESESNEEVQSTISDEHSETENNDETNTDGLTEPKVDTDSGILEGSVNNEHTSGDTNKGVIFLVVFIALAIALIIIVITLVYRAKKTE